VLGVERPRSLDRAVEWIDAYDDLVSVEPLAVVHAARVGGRHRDGVDRVRRGAWRRGARERPRSFSVAGAQRGL